jgi:4-hydroxybenzoate polyprenyltransferase
VSIPFAVGSGLTLFVVAFLLSGLLPWRFSLVLAGYFLLTSAYSLTLKKIAVLDVVTLASLYTIRILAGGAATEVAISEWLLTFSLFIFFSLACMKRLSELLGLAKRNLTETVGRGYHADDVEQMAIFGSVSGYLSILVLALYINSPIVSELYAKPSFLWLLCPVLLFWITRIWLLARRGEVHEDPIVFALRDRASYVVFGLAIGIMLFASAPL